LYARFKYWFVNIYWYHYKLHTFVAAFILAVVAITVYSALTGSRPDFVFIVASEYPVYEEQGRELAGFWAENADGVTELSYSVLFMSDNSEYAMTNWQLLTIALISEDHSLFIIGESLLPLMTDYRDEFYTFDELGLSPRDGPEPAFIPLEGAPLMDTLGFGHEPMYGLVKRPPYGRGGSVKPEDSARSALSAACLRALLGA
jgi:hypothetical protein